MLKKPVIIRREEPIVLVVSTKVVEPIVGVIDQPIKTTRVPLRYPYIFVLALNIVHLIVLERHKFKICFKLNQPLLPL